MAKRRDAPFDSCERWRPPSSLLSGPPFRGEPRQLKRDIDLSPVLEKARINPMSQSPTLLPWQVRVGQAEDGSWVAEVTFANLPLTVLETIAQSVGRYQQISMPQMAACVTSAKDPTRLFFVLGKPLGAHPVQILENRSREALSEPVCRRLAGDLAGATHTLHQVGLGLWMVDPRLLWEVDGKFLLVPAFWLPGTAGTLTGVGRLAPEIAGTSEQPAYDPRIDIFAIAFTCYEALADAPPLLPHPKLPGDWDPRLKAWDAPLDAGLRIRPDRRPHTISEWMTLLAPQENLPSAWSVPQVSQAPPHAPTKTSPAMNPTANVRSGILSPRRLLVFGVVIAVLLAGLLLRDRVFGGSYKRGFADSIVRYANKSYDGAKWKEIYSSDHLRPGWGDFKRICGWDESNFAILGKGDVGGTEGPLVVLFRSGMKDLPETFEGGSSVGSSLIDARFLDSERMVLFYCSPSGNAVLALKGPAGLQKLGTESANFSTRLALLAPDIIFATGAYITPWRFSGGKFSTADKESQDYYVRGENNVVAVSGRESMEVKYVTSITTLSPGRAVGLWTYESIMADHTTAAIVRYESGKWRLVQVLTGFSPRTCPTRAWFMDERNMVAIGSPKVIRVKDGKVIEHPLTLDGKPFSGEELIAVWGNSPDKFWVSDKKGNVFGFNGGSLAPIMRGPEFKDRDGREDRGERFIDIWVSPASTVFGVTRNGKLYQLK